MSQPKPAPPEADDTAGFILPSKAIAFNGWDMTIEPMELLQSMQLAKILKPALPALDQLGELMAETADEFGMVRILAELYADHGPIIIEAVALLTGKDAAAIGKTRDVSGMVDLLRAIVEVNRDFFAQQAGKHLADLKGKLSAGVGLMPSTASAAPATH